MSEQVALNSIKVNKPRCPYCHDDIQSDDEKAGCNQCMAWFHEECWQEHGGCTSCTSPTRPLRAPEVPRGQLTTTPQRPTIHHRLGYALLTPEHKKDAAKVARALAGKVAGLSLLLTCFPVLQFCLRESLSYFMIVILFNWLGALLAIYLTAYGYKKQKALRQSLGEILEQRGQPQQSDNQLRKE